MKLKVTILLLLFVFSPFKKGYIYSVENNQLIQSYIDQAVDYFEKGKTYSSTNPDSAVIYRSYIRESLLYYEKAGITAYHSFFNLLIGSSLFNENKPDSALMTYQENPNLPEDEIKKQTYLLITHANRRLGLHDSALLYGIKLIDQATLTKDSLMIASALYSVADVYNDMGNKSEALVHFKQAARMAEIVKDHLLASRSYNAQAAIYNNLNEPQQALPMAEEALKYAELAGDILELAGVWATIATSYYLQGKYADAINNYQKAMRHYEETGNEQLYSMIESVITFIRSDVGEKDIAVKNVITPQAKENVKNQVDSLSIPNSYQDLQLQLLTSNFNAADKKLKFDILHQEYLERQAASLRQRIWFISLLSGLIIIVLLLLYNRQRQKAKAEASARYAREKEKEYISLQQETELRMIRKYIDGLESERGRISKELHDGICNDLLALEIELKNNDGDISKQTEFLHKTRENIRNVSHELMPPVFQHATIDEILYDYVSRFPSPTGVKIRYVQNETEDWDIIPQKFAFEIYRITQEALSNSIKHAAATEINVSLTVKDEKVILEICDNGTGFDKASGSNRGGMQTISERVESINGELYVDTGESGTTIKAVFNLQKKNDGNIIS